MDQSLIHHIQEEDFIFDYRRAIYWPSKKVLITTDLHWGKTTYLQKHGIAISDNVFDEDLKRLGSLLKDFDVQTLLVLGDLIHHEKSLSHSVIEKVASLRNEHPSELILIQGNHDRYTQFPDSWGIVVEKDMKIGPFFFSHEHQRKNKDYQFSGHVHPMVRLKSGFDTFRVPAFILTENSCLLPAFSHLTGGQDIKLGEKEKAIIVLPEGIDLLEQTRPKSSKRKPSS